MKGRLLFPLILLGAVAYLFIAFHAILLPFLLAATAAYVLNPLVVLFEVRGFRRKRAVMLIYLVLLCSFVGSLYLAINAIIQNASTAAADMPQYLHQAQDFLTQLQNYPWVKRLGIAEWMQTQGTEEAHVWVLKFIGSAPTLIKEHILPLLELAFLVPFLTYFFMMDGPEFMEGLLDMVPSRYVEMCLNIWVEIDNSFGNYLRGLLMQAGFIGLFTGICFASIGLHYAVYIAIWAAISSMIPFLGPISAALAGGLVALFQWGTMAGMVKVLGVFIVIRTIDDWFLQPMILRRAVSIHPAITTFSLLAGAYAAGMWGLLFAVPVVCMLKVLLQVGFEWYRIEYGPHTTPISPEVIHIPIV